MARTQTGATLTTEQRTRQLAVRAQTIREFQTIWPLWNPADPRTFDRLVTATIPLIDLRRRTSSGVAADYYTAFRVAEGVGGPSAPRIADPAPRAQLVTSLHVTGRRQVARSVTAGFSPQAAKQNALVTMSGSVGRHVLNGGRQTLTRSTASDRRARGWRRITDADPCDFCSMLAGRGAVFSKDTVDFQAHDHCACTAEPAY